MYDLERINIIMKDIETYLKKLESLKIKSEGDLKDDRNFYASSMLIFSAINRSIDLAEQIVKDRGLGSPIEYRELFDMLERGKIISSQTAEKIKDLIILRNKISHRYGNLKEKDVFQALKRTKEIQRLIEEIEREIRKK